MDSIRKLFQNFISVPMHSSSNPHLITLPSTGCPHKPFLPCKRAPVVCTDSPPRHQCLGVSVQCEPGTFPEQLSSSKACRQGAGGLATALTLLAGSASWQFPRQD
jgi:hypothetical protein